MFKKRAKWLLLAFAMLWLLCSCGAEGNGNGSSSDPPFGSIMGLTSIGDTIELEFDAVSYAWDLSQIVVDDIDMEANGSDLSLCTGSVKSCTATLSQWGVDIDILSDTITFTHPTDGANGDIAAGSQIIVEIGNNANFQTSGINQIVNPAAAGDYEINMVNTYSALGGGIETGEVEIPIVDDDTVNVHGYIDTVMSFDIDTAVSNVHCDAAGGVDPCNSHGGVSDGAGYVIDLGEMSLSSVNKSGDSVVHVDGLMGEINYLWFDLETNASGGAVVTVISQYEGLYKDASNIIPSVGTSGEIQISAASGLYGFNHRSGFANNAAVGSMTVDGDCDCSGGDDYYCDLADGGTPISILDSNSLPVDDGRIQFAVGATPDSADGTGTYTDQLTFVATSTF